MPASEVQKLYREHKLHSGPGGPIVKNPAQATAIQIGMARKEGHHIPYPKGSMQEGGSTAPEFSAGAAPGLSPAGDVGAALTPTVAPKAPKQGGIHLGGGRGGDNPYLAAMQANVNAPLHRVEGFQEGGLVPQTGVYKMHGGETVIPAHVLSFYRSKAPEPTTTRAPAGAGEYQLHQGEAVVPDRKIPLPTGLGGAYAGRGSFKSGGRLANSYAAARHSCD
jgi:hypothetical protein